MSSVVTSILKVIPFLSAPPKGKTETQKVQCNEPELNEKGEGTQICFMSDGYKMGDKTLYKNSEIKKITRSDGSIKGFLVHTGVGCKNTDDLPNQCKDTAISNYAADGKLTRVIPGINTKPETAKSIAYAKLPNMSEANAEKHSVKEGKSKASKTNSQGQASQNSYCDEPEQRDGKNIQHCYVQKTDAQGKYHNTFITNEISPNGEIRQSLIKMGRDCKSPESIPGQEGACNIEVIGQYSAEGQLTRFLPGVHTSNQDARDILPKKINEL